jgi:hypothetical protein
MHGETINEPKGDLLEAMTSANNLHSNQLLNPTFKLGLSNWDLFTRLLDKNNGYVPNGRCNNLH